MLSVEHLARPGLDEVSFKVADGECLAVTGASGSGKSLLLRAIADLDPNTGEARTKALVRSAVPAPQWRAQVAYVPAESGWWAPLAGDHFSEKADAVALLCAMLLPADALSWPVARLSSGERQRLALARTLMIEPAVLLLDEPTGALDEKATASVEKLLRQRLERGVSIVMVSHDRKQAERFASRMAEMDAGHMTIAPPAK